MTTVRSEAVLARFLAGRLSAPMTLMHLILEGRDVAEVDAALSDLARSPEGMESRALLLKQMLDEHRDGLAQIAGLLRTGLDHETTAKTPQAGLVACRALFDRLARQQPEAAVALYSLGSPALLDLFTDEIILWLRRHQLLSPHHRVLDFGCGIGRLAAALASEVGMVFGLDLSPEMIARARARHGRTPNLRFLVGTGDGPFRDASFDLILAVDSFPYVVQCGPALASAYIAEAARMLASGGDLIILNFSYRGIIADRADVARLAEAHGFACLLDGIACFTLWDGIAFRLRRASHRGRGSAPSSARG
ncbi:MAG: class I SAM-dependent methyltransferase [Alphaproteobacteria bacterium]|nr:class I SAM-dependent methyltransferase [Alphaproteobacteria bacterium]